MIILNCYIVFIVHKSYRIRDKMQGKEMKNDSNKRFYKFKIMLSKI